jgi:hypothetical protein
LGEEGGVVDVEIWKKCIVGLIRFEVTKLGKYEDNI